jgi:hypothetical protein
VMHALAVLSTHARHQPPEGRERETGRRVVAPLRHPGAAGGETHTTIELAPIRIFDAARAEGSGQTSLGRQEG